MVGPDRGGVVQKRRFQFQLRGLMVAVAIMAGLMVLLTPAPERNAPIIRVFGKCVIGRDDSVEVQDGSVRIGEDGEQAEIRASRIVVKKDSTTEVFGPGTILQRVR
jgi:hypothetical protein